MAGIEFALDIPPNFKILTVATQAGIMPVQNPKNVACIWIEADFSIDPVKQRFIIIGTGWEIPSEFHWCGTWQEKPYVWHLYHYDGVC